MLSPGGRTPSGHRLYGDSEVRRLRQIRSLVSVGLPLREIQRLLARPESTPDRSLAAQRNKIREQIGRLQKLLRRLESLDEASTAVELIEAIKEIEMTEKFEKYYTQEQLETLATRREQIGEQGMLQAQQDWAQLYADMRAAQREGLAPSHPRVQELARESRRLIEAFTGGDKGIEASLSNMYASEEGMRNEYLPEEELAEYMAKATAALEGDSRGHC